MRVVRAPSWKMVRTLKVFSILTIARWIRGKLTILLVMAAGVVGLLGRMGV